MSKKGGFLTPKAIGNRIKAKGLQKLRWYCEMCQKQCRDENGFKCHQTSEGHLRQMRIFAENPDAVMERYSKEFEELFLETLSRHHNTKRTHANLVYKEYIADKHHIHMNSTKFDTLTNFVKYLGKKGAIVADETEKGWFISWINR
jgi:DNA/RNA-binding protein KIN17